jgi:hypothetical protein
MHPQTRRAIKAGLVGLILSLIVTAVNIAANGLAPWELDESQPLNWEVISYWISRVGFLPALFVLIAVATSFRKSGASVSALNIVGGIVVLSLVIAIGVVMAAYVKSAGRSDTELAFGSGSARTYYVGKTIDSCVRNQRSRPENSGASETLIKNYCECFANALADTTTYAEVKYSNSHGTPSPESVAKIRSSGEKCRPSAR